ncbi:DinB family protein [Paenibacillus filicis]|uniref:DinB family protein n=1 Tax=Paenibacillus filicis TaxID=669464 RepID=A0ABU9DHK0_9BACL
MRTEFVFHILNKHHQQLLELVETCPEDQRLTIPEGFKNNLHWHIGHVLTVTEFHVFGLSEHTPGQVLPANYQQLFAYGTKPSDWQEEPPAWDLLIAQLKDQRNQLHVLLDGKLDVPVKENFLKAETFGELLVSTTLHLVDHLGFVSALLKVLKR